MVIFTLKDKKKKSFLLDWKSVDFSLFYSILFSWFKKCRYRTSSSICSHHLCFYSLYSFNFSSLYFYTMHGIYTYRMRWEGSDIRRKWLYHSTCCQSKRIFLDYNEPHFKNYAFICTFDCAGLLVALVVGRAPLHWCLGPLHRIASLGTTGSEFFELRFVSLQRFMGHVLDWTIWLSCNLASPGLGLWHRLRCFTVCPLSTRKS